MVAFVDMVGVAGAVGGAVAFVVAGAGVGGVNNRRCRGRNNFCCNNPGGSVGETGEKKGAQDGREGQVHRVNERRLRGVSA